MAHHAPCLAEIKKLLDENKKLKDENQRYLEALESISGKFSCPFCVKNMAITDQALEGEK